MAATKPVSYPTITSCARSLASSLASTLLPSGRYWLKASVQAASAGIPRLIAVHPQAVVARFRDRFKDLPRLIGQDRSYAWFLVVQMLATSAKIATPFYILYVTQKLHLHGAVEMGATLGTGTPISLK